MLKRISAILVMPLAALPFLVAAWFVFPLVAGVLLVALWRFSGRDGVRKYIGISLSAILLGMLVWFVSFGGVVTRPYEDGLSAAVIRRVGGESSGIMSESQQSAQQRTTLKSAIARERLKVRTIESALMLYQSADAASVNRDRKGVTDDVGLRAALETLRTEMEGGDGRPNLLDPQQLESLVKNATVAIDGFEQEATAETLTPEEIGKQQLRIPQLMSPYRIDPASRAVANLETTLRSALQSSVEASPTYRVEYDRASDELISEQRIRLEPRVQQVVAIDACGFLFRPESNTDNAEVFLERETSGEQQITSNNCRQTVPPETKFLMVRRVSRRTHASHALINAALPIPFRGITVHWPLPSFSSAVMTLRFADDSSVTWPLALSVETPVGATLEHIRIPRNSFYHANHPVTVANTGDFLTVDGSAGRVAELAAGTQVEIELLPNYLSTEIGQSYKQYLGAENLASALIVSILTGLFGIIATRKGTN